MERVLDNKRCTGANERYSNCCLAEINGSNLSEIL